MSTCSDVTTCLSEGSTECKLTSNKCPPCVYALTGDDYSCYSRDPNGDCPFSGIFAECESTSTSTSSKSTTNSSSSSDSTLEPTRKPRNVITETSTENPSDTIAEIPTSDTSDFTMTGSASTTRTNSPPATSGSDPAQSSKTAPSAASDSGSVPTVMSNTAASSNPPMVANLALVGGAVVLVVIVIAFVTRQVMKKKKMVHKLQRTGMTRSSHQSDGTLSSGASSVNVYSTYRVDDDNGISMLSDSQASSTYGPGYDDHNRPSRSMADFSNYGESQFAENSQYYSVSTGPGVAAHYAKNGMPPSSTQAGSHFVDVTASSKSNRPSELDSARSDEHPLTVSQLMPKAMGAYDEKAYASRPKPGSLLYGHVQPKAYDSAVPRSNRQPQMFGVSTASSMRSDYDIVDPITMREVEARNTEMLAEHNHYPKFSFESQISLYDESSSEDEGSDDERMRHTVEHTI